MKVVNGNSQLEGGWSQQGSVVTIGNFDGVHRGHQEILKQAKKQAETRRLPLVAYTFRPHPHVVLRPQPKVQLLTTYEERLEHLAQNGVHTVIEEPFTRYFSSTPADRFFMEILLRKLGARAIVVGYDFSFGKDREGSLKALEQFCNQAGVDLTVVQAHKGDGGGVISSSRIRELLSQGKVKDASHLLGYDFYYRGVVIRGEGRGRKIGFPTANLKLDNKLALPFGVYATYSTLEGTDQKIASVTNVGTRPTFFEGEIPALVETHLLNTDQDLYGTTLKVDFVKRLREEKKFDGVDSLVAQIKADVTEARKLL